MNMPPEGIDMTAVILRPATDEDAWAMAAVQNAIFWARFPVPPCSRARHITSICSPFPARGLTTRLSP